tara:strand:+ start:525052 stop:525309 length:258 start_codon:yes stop_codon:yes gene_type:complete
MKFSTQVKPISYLKKHAAKIVEEICETRQPMLITQHGMAKLVLMDLKSYEEQKETIAFLKILALGNCEIEQGQYCSAEEFLATAT